MTKQSIERWQAEVESRLARLELLADEVALPDASFEARAITAITDAEDHPDLESWVANYFLTTFPRPLGGDYRWCSQWQEHQEAVVRLDALWCAWKSLRRDPKLGMSTWLHNFLDPQIIIIGSAHGTFAQCSVSRHEVELCQPLGR